MSKIGTSSIFFIVYGQFRAIWKSDSWCMVSKSDIFIGNNLFSYKNQKHNSCCHSLVGEGVGGWCGAEF